MTVKNLMNKVIPQSSQELKNLVLKEVLEHGFNCDLNHIDTSLISNMTGLFAQTPNKDSLHYFNGDISSWDTSNVVSMSEMFKGSLFNGDISNWNTAKVSNMMGLFYVSQFNQDISKWNISKVVNMYSIFDHSKFNQSIENWNPVNLQEVIISKMYKDCVAPRPSWLIEDNHKRNLYLLSKEEKNRLNTELTGKQAVVASQNQIFKV